MRRAHSSLIRALALGTALLAAVQPCRGANDGFSRDDAFEFSNLSEIRHFPLWDSAGTRPDYFSIQDLFGGFLGNAEFNGELAFSDWTTPADMVEWVEFDTFVRVPLEQYRVAVRRDYPNARQVERITLLAIVDPSNLYKVVDSYVPDYVAGTGTYLNSQISAPVRILTNRVVAKSWRVEFTRNLALQQGSRIIEVDAMVTTPQGEPPAVSILTPEPDAFFFSDESIPVAAAAYSAAGIHSVELYLDDKFIETQTNAFRFTVSNPPVGIHTLTAKAIDKMGGESSASVGIQIGERPAIIELSSPRIGGGYVHFDVSGGKEARNQVIYSSLDLLNWSVIKTNVYPGERWTFSDPADNQRVKFYKAAQLPQP